MWRLPWNLGASISWNPQGLSRPVIGLLYLHRIYKQVCDTCTFILTVPHIVSFWDPKMHYKCWYIWSVLQKAWWWLNTVETRCLKCNCIVVFDWNMYLVCCIPVESTLGWSAVVFFERKIIQWPSVEVCVVTDMHRFHFRLATKETPIKWRP